MRTIKITFKEKRKPFNIIIGFEARSKKSLAMKILKFIEETEFDMDKNSLRWEEPVLLLENGGPLEFCKEFLGRTTAKRPKKVKLHSILAVQ